jgi:hypothetical protein
MSTSHFDNKLDSAGVSAARAFVALAIERSAWRFRPAKFP